MLWDTLDTPVVCASTISKDNLIWLTVNAETAKLILLPLASAGGNKMNFDQFQRLQRLLQVWPVFSLLAGLSAGSHELLNRFSRNLDGGQVSDQKRPH